MGRVRMRNPDDGKVYEFDSAQGREALANGWSQDLNAGQQIGKGLSDMAPALGATAGAIIGVPGGPAGMAAGGLYGAGLGATGRELGYSASGVMKDDRLPQMAGRFAYEGAQGLMSGLGQSVGSVARPGMALGTMKGAIGKAEMGVPEAMMSEGITVNPAGLTRVQRAIDAAKAQKAAVLGRVGQSWRVSYKTFEQAMQRAINQAEQSDIVSPRARDALQKALQHLQGSVGPKVTGGQVTQVLDQYGRPMVTPVVTTPAKPMTLAQVEQIRAWAGKQIKAYRQANGFAPSGPPDPIELGYQAVEETARNLVNGIRTTGGTVGDINARISKLIEVGKALTDRLTNPPAVNPAASAMSSLASTVPGVGIGFATHNPVLGAEIALGGGALGAGMNHLAHDPATLSRIALAMQQPNVQRGLFTQAPVRLADVYGRLMGFSDPQAKPGPFGTVGPEGQQ